MAKSKHAWSILILIMIVSADHPVGQTRPTDISLNSETNVERDIKSLEEARNQAVLHGDEISEIGRAHV